MPTESLLCKVQKIHPDAIIPSKAHPSDVGYDLTIIELAKTIGQVRLYSTGLIIEPPVGGWSVDIVPRSSIIKTGHLQANSIGIIDPHYRGPLMIALWKYDNDSPELNLPFKIGQMIFRSPAPNILIWESTVDVETDRGPGGFGSTDN